VFHQRAVGRQEDLFGERPAVLGELSELDLWRWRGPLLLGGIFRQAWRHLRCFRSLFRKLRLGLRFALGLEWLGVGLRRGFRLGFGGRDSVELFPAVFSVAPGPAKL